MEVSVPAFSNFWLHYKKILLICGIGFTCYLMKKYIDNRKKLQLRRERKKVKNFPSIEEIQRFIEELPFNDVKANKNVTLKDLLGELSEFSEDEDWKELIASVHSMYNQEENVQSDHNFAIYEDPCIVNDSPSDLKKLQEIDNLLFNEVDIEEAVNNFWEKDNIEQDVQDNEENQIISQ
ncbi:hypothetical protein GWI33_021709 [Rhynchophorus ferrugineus]|uniref:Uncharacterized protein n=1 Tax=Rhynchophorus ferrugineus TaxID=354439 RepID=A0A834MIC9_RHYFE|nr:hypothetical protein GWI33_021709 [Rhynchophorus ferrugineus]